MGPFPNQSENTLATYQETMTLRSYRKQPYWALRTYRVRHNSINTPLSHERLVGGLQDGGRGTHVTHFVQLYPQPLYTASQVRTTYRSWDEGVLTDLRLTWYYNLLGPLSYMWSVVDQNVIMQHITVYKPLRPWITSLSPCSHFVVGHDHGLCLLAKVVTASLLMS